jgi:hypothetical protein
MSQEIIKKINSHIFYEFDEKSNRVVNLLNGSSDIDEFLHIQHILDCHYIPYRFEKGFHIQILNLK